MVHFQVRQQNQSKEDAQQSHLIGKCLASCVLSYRRCQPSHRLIYRFSIGRVSIDISVDISTKYRRIYRSSVSRVLVDCRSSIGGCISQPLVNSQPRQCRQYVSEYRQQSIGNVHVLVVYRFNKHRHCLFNFFTDLFCSAFHTTSYQSYIRYCQQYHCTHVTKRSKLSYRYVIFGDGQTVKSTN